MTTLACPACRERLDAVPGEYACPRCRKRFPVTKGVVWLRCTTADPCSAEDVRAWEDPHSGRVEHGPAWRALVAKEAQIRHLERVLHRAGLEPGSRTLEIGSGIAWASVTIKTMCPTATVVATDIAEAALLKARQVAAVAEVELDFLAVADAHALPFADETFDVVVESEALHHLADPARALREIRRVLRPGGRFLGIGEGAASLPMRAVLAATGRRRRLGGPEATRYAMREALYSFARWHTFVEAAGFSSFDLRPVVDPTLNYQGPMRARYYALASLAPANLVVRLLGCAVVIEARR